MEDLREALIRRLPKTPEKTIVWVVYDIGMIRHITNLFNTLKGEGYAEKYVKVVPRNMCNKPKGRMYFDPYLGDLLKNAA